jgi:hypothetical protein
LVDEEFSMATERRRNRDRRSPSAARPRSYSELYRNDTTVAPTPAVATATPAVVQESAPVNWSQEYYYVAKDLRRLMLVSGTLFVLIIIAGFFF